MKLLERFYDPVSGSITLDGFEINQLNVKWLREQIGFVGQEPVLFATTVKQNLMYGLSTKQLQLPSEEIDKLIEIALKSANAFEFVEKLPKKLNTFVGEAGSTLSGGQKQRLCIARSILSNPKILLLDEATSALDTKSERIVQEALDAASKGRTTITIAHRLSTIKNSDLIIVMKEGEIIEKGTHNELLNLDGLYKSLVDAQNLKMESTLDLKSDLKADETVFDSNVPIENPNFETLVKIDQKEETKDLVATKQRKPSYARLFRLNSPEWFLILLGSVSAGINGALMPLFGIFD